MKQKNLETPIASKINQGVYISYNVNVKSLQNIQ